MKARILLTLAFVFVFHAVTLQAQVAPSVGQPEAPDANSDEQAERGTTDEPSEVEPEAEKEEPTEKRKLHINVNPERAKIGPTVEISLPSGNLNEHFEQPFNQLNMQFDLNYNIFDNKLDLGVAFAYPLKRLTPLIKFFDSVDFDNYVTPQISGTDFILTPTNEYLSRTKGIDFELSYRIYKNLSFLQSFVFSNVFKGDLSGGAIIDEGNDLTERVGLVYNSVQVKESTHKIRIQGTYARSIFGFRFRNSFSNPISIDVQNSVLSHVTLSHAWNLDAQFGFDTPIEVYQAEKFDFYSLGGFDTIRGYDQGTLDAFRFALMRTTWVRAIFPEKEITFNLFKHKTTAHEFKLLFLLDGLLSQQQLDLRGPVDAHSSVGAGFSFLVTGIGKTHLHFDLSIAQPLESGYTPIFYLKGSLFNITEKL